MTELQPRLFARAIDICGSAKALCAQLGVEEHSVRLWMAERARAPERIFLAVVDLILEDDLARAAQDRRRAPRQELTVIDGTV
jgi:DNA-binding transcriptional regulator YdaS (Cro superfamily)